MGTKNLLNTEVGNWTLAAIWKVIKDSGDPYIEVDTETGEIIYALSLCHCCHDIQWRTQGADLFKFDMNKPFFELTALPRESDTD